ncbi:hypothetical protein P3T27_006820 [Kitasatospora sp. MAA19]|uniref:hypothetical protein n=1 Tax=unclassified Kitasatospora TaxID=2633591 RepID=UPI002472FC1B|nr:hypothetical protein [Kitasatospora sp. MAA19]MDH6710071.1 hypothetical protein [Kitasatospora sp. MAA19]
MYRPTAELACTAGAGDERLRPRAFVELHRPGGGDEQTVAQLTACTRLLADLFGTTA